MNGRDDALRAADKELRAADEELKAAEAGFRASDQQIEAFIQREWPSYLNDLNALVSVESVEDLAAATPGAPFGPGPREALTRALGIADRMGFTVSDLDGYVGIADMPATSAAPSGKQLGIIGHVDVVPAGPGWTLEPYAVTLKDGYVAGRGVMDDKGPVLLALYAMKFWKDAGAQFPHDIRMLFGANEETGMGDVPYYQQRFADPDFLFTPDAEFPVCYGEKGMFHGSLVSQPLCSSIVDFQGGTVTNGVPGTATATVRVCPEHAEAIHAAAPGIAREVGLPDDALTVTTTALSEAELEAANANLSAEDAAVLAEYGNPVWVRIDARGRSAHASTPEKGVSAIRMIVELMLRCRVAWGSDQAFLEAVQRLVGDPLGSGWGIACRDDDFQDLTIVGGTIAVQDNCLVQTFDCRFPTTTDVATLTAAVQAQAAMAGATMVLSRTEEVFRIDPTSDAVRGLMDAYTQVTGEEVAPFTMGGGTYARKFAKAVSFGLEKPDVQTAEWVGSMHGPNEGILESQLQEALKIYILAIGRLMEIDL